MIPLQKYLLIYFSVLPLLGFQVVFRLLCYSSSEITVHLLLHAFPLLLELVSPFRKLDNSMFNQLYVDLAITVSETRFPHS